MSMVNKNAITRVLNQAERRLPIPVLPVTVLGYHAVSNDQTIVDITKNNFERQIAFLKKHFQFITLDHVTAYIQGKQSFSKPAVALTFDDGYQDVYKTIAPLLIKNKIPATFFVMSDLAHSNRKELANKKQLMTFKELKELQRQGFTIGCHSATHANLSITTTDLQKEIRLSKKNLEKLFGTRIPYFAYPKGIYNAQVIAEVKRSEFNAAFAFEAGFIKRNTNLYIIPRMPVDWTHTQEQFEAFFTHWGVAYYLAKKRILNIWEKAKI